ncbi:MAG: hypothetical protein QM632_02880 [Micrococcaceae bacterium]
MENLEKIKEDFKNKIVKLSDVTFINDNESDLKAFLDELDRIIELVNSTKREARNLGKKQNIKVKSNFKPVPIYARKEVIDWLETERENTGETYEAIILRNIEDTQEKQAERIKKIQSSKFNLIALFPGLIKAADKRIIPKRKNVSMKEENIAMIDIFAKSIGYTRKALLEQVLTHQWEKEQKQKDKDNG